MQCKSRWLINRNRGNLAFRSYLLYPRAARLKTLLPVRTAGYDSRSQRQDTFYILISFPIQIFILKESHTSPYPQRPGTYSSRVDSYCTRRSRGKWKEGIYHGSNQPIRNLPSGQVTYIFHIYINILKTLSTKVSHLACSGDQPR